VSFLKDLFSKKEEPIQTYADFWNWFLRNERSFHKTIKNHNNIEEDFFNKLSPKLDALHEGYFFLTGMLDDNTAELILTADGAIKNIVFVEELVQTAPNIPGWKFTSLKPSLDISNVRIQMNDHVFDSDTLWFYSNDLEAYPDQIDITVVHRDYSEKDKSTIINGTYIFLDNYIGELNSVTTIDSVEIIAKDQAKKELVPIEKLKAFLLWRQKEFVEKYEGTLQEDETSEFAVLEAELNKGGKLVATINRDVLDWEKKASHPWIAVMKIPYDGRSRNGMPDDETYQMLGNIEDKVQEQLSVADGHIYIGRQSADNEREVYFACKDFRKPSKVLDQMATDHPGMNITYDIYKDKYWRSFERFRVD
jgi:hypothetical protein